MLIVLDDCIGHVFSHWAWRELIKKSVTAGAVPSGEGLAVSYCTPWHCSDSLSQFCIQAFLFSGHCGVCVKAEAFDGVSGA